jgi:purine nucleosidase
MGSSIEDQHDGSRERTSICYTPPSMRTKVLLDTDIGSDIDDAVALAWLLANPECDLLGITTVSGCAEDRARIASALCRAAGRAVPIFPGSERPLLGAQKQPAAPQAAALKAWPHDEDFPPHRAVWFLQQTIREHPGEIVLLTIGPLTNAALLFSLDPEIPGLLRGMVSMCGLFSNRAQGYGPAEWNASLDPLAAAIVYRNGPRRHRTVGLDVTTRLRLDVEEFRRRFALGPLKPVLDFSEAWFRHRDAVVFHDPLAAAVIFDESLCRFVRGTVDVELESRRLAGTTHWSVDPAAGRHEIAASVDRDAFFHAYFAPFTGGGPASPGSA